MRGQKLYVRPMEPEDVDAVETFLAEQVAGSGSQVGKPDQPSPTSDLPAQPALLGKLVGNLVAVLTMRVTDDGVEIRDLVVAHDLRKKRIGRFMIDELDRLAGKMERDWLVADRSRGRDFLERVGFHDNGEHMVRRVRR